MTGKERPVRLALCDDHRIITDGLQRLLSEIPGIECVGNVQSGVEALFLLQHVQVDIMLMDLDMPEMDGTEAMAQIKTQWPAVKVLILTMHDEPAVVRRLMELGADGYLLKTCGTDELVAAIHAVHQGRKHFSATIVESLLDQSKAGAHQHTALSDLTAREKEVLSGLAEGLSNKEIGERHFISPRTVDTHRTNMMRKLNMHNLADLVRLAIRAGLVK